MSERSWTGAVPPSGGCNHRGNLKLKFDGGRNAVLCEDCRTVLGYARHTEPASNEDERMPECPREGCPATIDHWHDGERVVYTCSVWVPVEPGTVIKAGTRIRSEGEGGSAHEYTAGMDFSIDDPGAWAVFIDPRTVPAEPDAALIAELRQYVTSATSDDELRDMIAAVRKADDARAGR